MKKRKMHIVLLSFFLVVFVGCSSKEIANNTVTSSQQKTDINNKNSNNKKVAHNSNDENSSIIKTKKFIAYKGYITSELTYEYKGDTILKQEAKTKYLLTANNFPKDKVLKETEMLYAKYNEVKGVKYEKEIKGEFLEEYIEVDFRTVDFRKFKTLPGFDVIKQASSVDKISMTKIEKFALKNGYKLTK